MYTNTHSNRKIEFSPWDPTLLNSYLHHLYKFQVATTPCSILLRSANNAFRSIKDNKVIAMDAPNTQKADPCWLNFILILPVIS